jgi:hypothetical protein
MGHFFFCKVYNNGDKVSYLHNIQPITLCIHIMSDKNPFTDELVLIYE